MQRRRAARNKEFDEKARKARVDRNTKAKAEQMRSVSMMKQEKLHIMKEIVKFENSEMKRNRERKEVQRQILILN